MTADSARPTRAASSDPFGKDGADGEDGEDEHPRREMAAMVAAPVIETANEIAVRLTFMRVGPEGTNLFPKVARPQGRIASETELELLFGVAESAPAAIGL